MVVGHLALVPICVHESCFRCKGAEEYVWRLEEEVVSVFHTR